MAVSIVGLVLLGALLGPGIIGGTAASLRRGPVTPCAAGAAASGTRVILVTNTASRSQVTEQISHVIEYSSGSGPPAEIIPRRGAVHRGERQARPVRPCYPGYQPLPDVRRHARAAGLTSAIRGGTAQHAP